MKMKPIKVIEDGIVEVNDVKYWFDNKDAVHLQSYVDSCNSVIDKKISETEDEYERAIVMQRHYGFSSRVMERMTYSSNIENMQSEKINLKEKQCKRVSIYVGLLCVEYEDGYNDFIVLGKDCDSFRHYYDVEKSFPIMAD